MQTEKRASASTLACYKRDLKKAMGFLEELGVTASAKVSRTNLRSYVLQLEKEGLSAATISRNVASLHSFFHYLLLTKKIGEDPSEELSAPKVEKKLPRLLTVEQMEKLFEQPDTKTAKGIRDRSMLTLFCTTGIGVQKLLSLKTGDVDLKGGLLRPGGGEELLFFNEDVKHMLQIYLGKARAELIKGQSGDILFCNYMGQPMSRQGFWKMVRAYAAAAGIKENITPHSIKCSLTLHMLKNGANINQLSAKTLYELTKLKN